MKAFSSLEQSKQLAEILPPESADMHYAKVIHGFDLSKDWKFEEQLGSPSNKAHIPCWSLAALLDLLPEQSNLSKRYAEDCETMVYWVWISSFDYESEEYTNPIDACYEMVLKLKEKDLL